MIAEPDPVLDGYTEWGVRYLGVLGDEHTYPSTSRHRAENLALAISAEEPQRLPRVVSRRVTLSEWVEAAQ